MYSFEQTLPFLPPTIRLKLCFSILELHIAFRQGFLTGLSESELVQVVAAYNAMCNYEMFVAESRGQTNTNGYPTTGAAYPLP